MAGHDASAGCTGLRQPWALACLGLRPPGRQTVDHPCMRPAVGRLEAWRGALELGGWVFFLFAYTYSPFWTGQVEEERERERGHEPTA
jgi:hypothetical protein